MKRILVVEDDTNRILYFKKVAINNNWKIIFSRTYISSIFFLLFFRFDTIFLDHDLIGRKTGHDVAKFIRKFAIQGQIIIHSLNSVGAQNIQNVLPGSIRIPFYTLKNSRTFLTKGTI